MMRGVRFWMSGIQALLRGLVGLDYEVRGREHLPPGPAIIAAKHQSAWETLAFNLIVPDLVVALKRELLRLPFFGWFARKSRMIGIDRRHGASALRSLVREAEVVMARGERLLIFPEGTRVAPGKRVRYQPGTAALYGRLDRPVVPVALNSGLFWSRRGFLKRPGLIVVEFLPPIPPGLDRRAFEALLAERLETATDRLIAEARGTRGGDPVRDGGLPDAAQPPASAAPASAAPGSAAPASSARSHAARP
jgi:1-acyl-sn-glycerol-3-phosphate acyltransferase